MATHDYIIANASGAAVRADLNNALAAIVSNNSNATAPATTYAYQWWADTTANQLKLRNSANDDWIVIQELDGTMLMEDGSASTPGLAFASDLNTGFFRSAADKINFATGGTERLEIGSTESVFNDGGADVDFRVEGDGDPNLLFVDAGNDRIGIINNSPSELLTVGDSGNTDSYISVESANNTEAGIKFYADSTAAKGFNVGYEGNGNLFFIREDDSGTISDRLLISDEGAVLIGGTTAPSSFNGVGQTHNLIVAGSTDNTNIASNSGAAITISNTDGTTDNTSGLHFAREDTDGSPHYTGASIVAQFQEAQVTGQYPKADLAFLTSTSANSAPDEKMRLLSGGQLLVGTTTINPGVGNTTVGASINGDGYISACRNATVAYFSRTTTDGTLVSFAQGGTGEGTISVSGTTVSYNGAHLSRWSQLAGGADRTEILRGSVLSNLDEMCEWGEEDNEQLNRMKVSDVEGDVNVAGVFQCWDDDDDTYTNDFYCAMTGDFVIRIAQGTTVARGDLLMSAGDGTAKPQDDDIVRSKTVAKVTSTTVSTTYADGSYCVPCVLMAC